MKTFPCVVYLQILLAIAFVDSLFTLSQIMLQIALQNQSLVKQPLNQLTYLPGRPALDLSI